MTVYVDDTRIPARLGHMHGDPIPADQRWFWSAEWQAGEREASEQITTGGLHVYETMAALLASAADATEPAGRRFMTDCPACVLVGGPFVLAEAERLAGTHDGPAGAA
jgi:hypothetical protein